MSALCRLVGRLLALPKAGSHFPLELKKSPLFVDSKILQYSIPTNAGAKSISSSKPLKNMDSQFPHDTLNFRHLKACRMHLQIHGFLGIQATGGFSDQFSKDTLEIPGRFSKDARRPSRFRY